MTANTQCVDQDDVVDPSDAAVHGLIGSMAKEYPNWQTKLIDVKNHEDLPVSEIFSCLLIKKGILGPIEISSGINCA